MPIQNAADVIDAHATLGDVDELLQQRRAVYSAAIELSCGVAAAEVPDSVLDNPAVRAHLGEVLSGTTEMDTARLVPVDVLVRPDVAVGRVHVASSTAALDALAPAVDRITGQLQRYGDRSGPRLLVETDDGFGSALRAVDEGVDLAMCISPALVSDLLPHVALVAILARADSGRLGSASSRDHPGLVMVPEPQSVLEMAEALVHEGAHQKFFDLAITRSLIGPDHAAAPHFVPSWAAPDSPPWPLEQCFAAFHAYLLLSVFNRDLRAYEAGAERPDELELLPHSLLPTAEYRAQQIGDWMVEQGRFLGNDGRAFVELLHGTRPAPAPAPVSALPLVDELGDADVVRHCGRRTLHVRGGSPVELYWVTRTPSSGPAESMTSPNPESSSDSLSFGGVSGRF